MRTRTPRVALALVWTATLLLGGRASAAPGDLDTTFSGDGVVRTNFGAGYDSVSALAIQADGRIVAAGFANRYRNGRFALSRHDTDGSLDGMFGNNGRIATDLTPGDDFASDVAILPDGRIVVAGGAGGAGGRFAVVRYEPDGSLDETFSGDGMVMTNFTPRNDAAFGLAIQPDGKTLVVGMAREGYDTAGHSDIAFALARYTLDGHLDATFSLDGKILADLTSGQDIAMDVVLQGDGRIVVAGRAGGDGGRFALLRYMPGGSRDPTFSGDGKVFMNFARGDDFASAVALQPDEKIVVAGTASRFSYESGFGLVRYGPDGTLDVSFSGDGKVVTRFAGNFDQAYDLGDQVHDVAVQADGKIVAAGSSSVSVQLGQCCDLFTAAARYTSAGILDDSFGGDGKVSTDLGYSHGANGLAIQADGRIVTGGEAFLDPLETTFVLLRYLAA